MPGTVPRSRRHRRQQGGQVPGQPLRRRAVEQVAVVLQRPQKPRAEIRHLQRQIELGAAPRQRHRFERQAAQRQSRSCFPQRQSRQARLSRPALAIEHEHRLEERRTAPVPLSAKLLRQPRQGIFLVRKGPQRRLPYAPQQLRERRVAGGIAAHHHRVHQVSHQARPLRTAATGRRRPDQHLRLSPVAVEQRHEACQQRHEARRTRRRPQRLQALAELPRQAQAARPAAEARHRRTRPVGGQRQHRQFPAGAVRPAQLAVPVGPQPLPLGPRQLRLLRPYVRSVRGRGRRQAGPPARHAIAPVERRQVSQQHPNRGEVRDQVMHRQHQQPLAARAREHRCPHQRTALEIERPLRRLRHRPGQCRLSPPGGVLLHQLPRPRRVHLPREIPVRRDERRAQRRVPRHDPGERAGEAVPVPPAQDSRRPRHHVRRIAPQHQAVQQQERPLTLRHGVAPGRLRVAGGESTRHRPAGVSPGQLAGDLAGQAGKARSLDQAGQRHPHAELRLDRSRDLRRCQRIDPQRQEGAFGVETGGVQRERLRRDPAQALDQRGRVAPRRPGARATAAGRRRGGDCLS